MKSQKYLFLVILAILTSGCFKKGGKSSGTSKTGQQVETGGGSGGGTSISLDSNSPTFHYTFNNISTPRNGLSVVSPSFPSAGSPSIDTSGVITSLTAVAEPAELLPTAESAIQDTTTSASAVVNQQATTRTHQVLLQSDATSCSSSMSLECSIDSGNAKQLNLTNINTSTFTSSTTNFTLTVNGGTVTVPMTQNKITLMQNHDSASSNIQLESRVIGEAVARGK